MGTLHFLIDKSFLQAHISEISKLCNGLATENQEHKLEIAALIEKLQVDDDARKAKAETENTTELAEFIQSDMWEVITNGTTVSFLTIFGVVMRILWKKTITKLERLKDRNPQYTYMISCKVSINKEMRISFDLILV